MLVHAASIAVGSTYRRLGSAGTHDPRTTRRERPALTVISVDDHLASILDAIPVLPPFAQTLLDSQGCVVCEDIACRVDLPGFDNSAMDGYAVQAADVAAASATNPVTLPVVGDIPAGHARAYAIRAGMAVRIMTGAMVPTGADAVVPLEATDGGMNTVSIVEPAAPGAHIRRQGGDAHKGDLLMPAGTVLAARHISALAASGYERVPVHPRPRVVVLSTGSELQAPGTNLGEAMIFDSNSFGLAAAARSAGAVAYRVGIVPDDPRQLLDLLEDQLVRADLIVTSGGVSVGAYDVVKEVLTRLGTVTFSQLAMQPGKPQGFGTIGEDSTPIFTLPGNPVSAFVSFEVFVRPAIRKMQGLPAEGGSRVQAVVTHPFGSPAGRRQFARARYAPPAPGSSELGTITPIGGQGSHQVSDLTEANALAIVPEPTTHVPAGARLTTILLDDAARPLLTAR
jgi:molybdopterin molybdotransferase